MLVTFADSKSALRVMDIDGAKVRISQTYNNNSITNFSKWLFRIRYLSFYLNQVPFFQRKIVLMKSSTFTSAEAIKAVF